MFKYTLCVCIYACADSIYIVYVYACMCIWYVEACLCVFVSQHLYYNLKKHDDVKSHFFIFKEKLMEFLCNEMCSINTNLLAYFPATLN